MSRCTNRLLLAETACVGSTRYIVSEFRPACDRAQSHTSLRQARQALHRRTLSVDHPHSSNLYRLGVSGKKPRCVGDAGAWTKTNEQVVQNEGYPCACLGRGLSADNHQSLVRRYPRIHLDMLTERSSLGFLRVCCLGKVRADSFK